MTEASRVGSFSFGRFTMFLACITGFALCGMLPGEAHAAPSSSVRPAEEPSLTPSRTRPYYACPPSKSKPHVIFCDGVIDPRAYRFTSVMSLNSMGASGLEPAYGGGKEFSGYDPEDLQHAYNLPSLTSGYGQTVAVVDAYDDPKAESDLAVYRSAYGLPPCTTANGCFKKVNEHGEQGSYPPLVPVSTKWGRDCGGHRDDFGYLSQLPYIAG